MSTNTNNVEWNALSIDEKNRLLYYRYSSDVR